MVVVSTINEMIVWVGELRIENWELVAKCYGMVGLVVLLLLMLTVAACCHLLPFGWRGTRVLS